MADPDDRITTIRSLINLVSSDTSETGPIPDVLHACSEALDSLAADLAAAEVAVAEAMKATREARRVMGRLEEQRDAEKARADTLAKALGPR